MKMSLAAVVFFCFASLGRAQDSKYDAMIQKGLAWLAKQQTDDGSCADATGYPSATTAFAGMAFLAEGSTLEQGKYRANLRRALAWFGKYKSNAKFYHGLLADIEDPRASGRYMSQHGVALSFLAKLYAETEDPKDRAKLRALLDDAVAFSVAGQTSFGGWFYTSAIEGHDSSENIATMLQVQGLLDARDAGLPVPRATLTKAHACLKSCTTREGGIVYSGPNRGKEPPAGGGRPSVTTMALAAYLPRQRPYDDTTRRWLAFCGAQPLLAPKQLMSSDLLVPYFLSRAACHLDAKEWQAAFPEQKLPEHLDWSKARIILFDHLQREQSDDGAWSGKGWSLGAIHNTSLALNILLYERTLVAPISR